MYSVVGSMNTKVNLATWRTPNLLLHKLICENFPTRLRVEPQRRSANGNDDSTMLENLLPGKQSPKDMYELPAVDPVLVGVAMFVVPLVRSANIPTQEPAHHETAAPAEW